MNKARSKQEELLGKAAVFNFVAIQLVGTVSTTEAVGATVVLHATHGGPTQVHEVRRSQRTHGFDDERIVFGLGPGSVDHLLIVWPSGAKQHVAGTALKLNEITRPNRITEPQPGSDLELEPAPPLVPRDLVEAEEAENELDAWLYGDDDDGEDGDANKPAEPALVGNVPRHAHNHEHKDEPKAQSKATKPKKATHSKKKKKTTTTKKKKKKKRKKTVPAVSARRPTRKATTTSKTKKTKKKKTTKRPLSRHATQSRRAPSKTASASTTKKKTTKSKKKKTKTSTKSKSVDGGRRRRRRVAPT